MRIASRSLLLWAVMLPVSISAQWMPTNGPYGGPVQSLLVLDGNLFAGTNRTIFRATKGAGNWTEPSNILPRSAVYTLGSRGATLFAFLYGHGIYRSSDNGMTWDSANNGLTSIYTNSIFGEGPYLFAGTANGVYRSTDDGTTWREASDGLPQNPRVTSFTARHLSPIHSELHIGTSAGVFSSPDSGSHWVPTAMTGPQVLALASKDSFLFAGTQDGRVYVSADGGAHWNSSDVATGSGPVASLAISGNSVFTGIGPYYYGTSFGVQRSTDNGASWSPAGLTALPVHSLAADDSILYAATDDGIYLSCDNGLHWLPMNTGLTALDVTSIAGAGSQYFAGTIQGIVLSSDSGASWNFVGLKNRHVSSLFLRGTILFAGLDGGAYGWGIFVSSDSGQSWQITELPLPTSIDGSTPADVTSFAASGGSLFTGVADRGVGGGGVYKSTDGGHHWKPTDIGFTRGNVWSLAVSGENLFAGTDSGKVYFSADSGANWTPKNISATTKAVRSLAVIDPFLFAATDSDGIFQSSDRGTNWAVANTGLPNGHLNVGSLIARDSALFFSTHGDGIFMSTDHGEHWTNINIGLPANAYVSALKVCDSDLVAGIDNGGIWMRPLSEMIVSGLGTRERDNPTAFSLDQNYPNPFNPKTVVSSQLPVASDVRIVIYDVLGREVALLINERRAAGSYQDSFDASGLASGTYICRMTAGAFVQSRKMLLIK